MWARVIPTISSLPSAIACLAVATSAIRAAWKTGKRVAALVREVSGSRREIRRLFGVVPRFFCYPAGRYDAEAVATVEAAGFEGATTTELGLARPANPFTLARVRVSRGDGAAGLARKLAALGRRGARQPR